MMGWGSVVSSPSQIQGEVPAENRFCCTLGLKKTNPVMTNLIFLLSRWGVGPSAPSDYTSVELLYRIIKRIIIRIIIKREITDLRLCLINGLLKYHRLTGRSGPSARSYFFSGRA